MSYGIQHLFDSEGMVNGYYCATKQWTKQTEEMLTAPKKKNQQIVNSSETAQVIYVISKYKVSLGNNFTLYM